MCGSIRPGEQAEEVKNDQSEEETIEDGSGGGIHGGGGGEPGRGEAKAVVNESETGHGAESGQPVDERIVIEACVVMGNGSGGVEGGGEKDGGEEQERAA